MAQKSTVLGEAVSASAEKLRILKENQQQIYDQAARGDIGTEQVRAYNRELENETERLSYLKSELKDNGHQIQEVGQRTGEAAKNSQAYTSAVDAQRKAVDTAKVSSEEHGKSLAKVKDSYKDAEKGALTFSDAVKASTLGNLFADGIQKAANALWDFAAAGAESARQLEVNERKLELVLRNTVNATDDYIESIKELIDQEERLGVVSGHSQTAAAQELATYVTKRGTLEKLIPVLNDMIAQQYGVNASQEQAVSVATALGKTLDGQVGSLQRWGYRFSEAEQRILKTGSEARKLNVIIKSVTDSVGGLNYGLKETTEEGRMFSAMLDIQAKQREFGKSVEKIKNDLLIALLPALTQGLETITDYIQKNESALTNLGSILATIINALAMLLNIVASIPAPLLILIAGIALAVKTFSAASAGLTALSTATRGLGGLLDPFTIKILAVVAALSVLLFLILAIKDGTDKASNSVRSLSNSAGNLANQNVNAGQYRGYATGTNSARRGLAWVGENGPELVNFRGGEKVWTAAQSARMANQTSNTTNSGGNYHDYRNVNINMNANQLSDMQKLLSWAKNYRLHERAAMPGSMPQNIGLDRYF